MKTTMELIASTTVRLTYVDNDETIVREFWIPTSGGYIRCGVDHSPDDPQACTNLAFRGDTLWAADGDDLLATIRKQWRGFNKLRNIWKLPGDEYTKILRATAY